MGAHLRKPPSPFPRHLTLSVREGRRFEPSAGVSPVGHFKSLRTEACARLFICAPNIAKNFAFVKKF